MFEWYNLIFYMFIILFFIWLFFGGKKYKYVGLGELMENKVTKEVEVEEVDYGYVPNDTKIEHFPDVKKSEKNERICRKTLEFWFKVPFSSVRPRFLKNPDTNRNLELDCYNEAFKLAVEYNGEQHYNFPSKYIREKEVFLSQVKNDKFKAARCAENGIHLIVVPYTAKGNIPHFIRERLPAHLKGLAWQDPPKSLFE